MELGFWPSIIGFDFGYMFVGSKELYGDIQLTYEIPFTISFIGASFGYTEDFTYNRKGWQYQLWASYYFVGMAYRHKYINSGEVEHVVSVFIAIPIFMGVSGPPIPIHPKK